MIGLTRRQADALRFIAGYIEAHGRSPYYQEIAEGLGLASTCSVHRLVSALEERARISRKACSPAGIEVLQRVSVPRDPDGAPMFFVQMEARRGL